MFIHEMRLERGAAVYIAEDSRPPFLLGLEASLVFFVACILSPSPSRSLSLFSSILRGLPASWWANRGCFPVGRQSDTVGALCRLK